MQLRSLRRIFSGTQLKFWIGLILHMLHYKMACIHSLVWLMTTPLHPQITHKPDVNRFGHCRRQAKRTDGHGSRGFGLSHLCSILLLNILRKSADMRLTFARFPSPSSRPDGRSQPSWDEGTYTIMTPGHFSLFYLIFTYLKASFGGCGVRSTFSLPSCFLPVLSSPAQPSTSSIPSSLNWFACFRGCELALVLVGYSAAPTQRGELPWWQVKRWTQSTHTLGANTLRSDEGVVGENDVGIITFRIEVWDEYIHAPYHSRRETQQANATAPGGQSILRPA